MARRLHCGAPLQVLPNLRRVLVEVPPNLLVEPLVPVVDRCHVRGVELDPALLVRPLLSASLHLRREALRPHSLRKVRGARIVAIVVGQSRIIGFERRRGGGTRVSSSPRRNVAYPVQIAFVVGILPLRIVVVVGTVDGSLLLLRAGIHLPDAVVGWLRQACHLLLFRLAVRGVCTVLPSGIAQFSHYVSVVLLPPRVPVFLVLALSLLRARLVGAHARGLRLYLASVQCSRLVDLGAKGSEAFVERGLFGGLPDCGDG
mmetsp:Transcript_27167/g.57684  ORF Transcript_27167/g.57684 Transcript_27167/m.57684 type:complete len:259 (-) Transcript_27167:1104-1880(-)